MRKNPVLDQLVEGSVVGAHQGTNVVLPVQSFFVEHLSEVHGDGLICHLCLAVALWVVGCGGCVLDIPKSGQFFGQLGTKFISLICDYLKRTSKSADPSS